MASPPLSSSANGQGAETALALKLGPRKKGYVLIQCLCWCFQYTLYRLDAPAILLFTMVDILVEPSTLCVTSER
jgi:hypothetical protein